MILLVLNCVMCRVLISFVHTVINILCVLEKKKKGEGIQFEIRCRSRFEMSQFVRFVFAYLMHSFNLLQIE